MGGWRKRTLVCNGSDIVDDGLGYRQEDLIRMLNPVLRGWAEYHSPVVAKQTFSRMDSLINWRLRRWAKRRHPTKNAEWRYRKYWRAVGDRRWVFAVNYLSKTGSKGLVELINLADTPIVRHKKVKGAYNPYDPSWEEYGEALRQERMLHRMRYQREWAKLFADQRGRCAYCMQEMDMDTGWHDHHIKYRMEGGSDALGNRVLLHPTCHAKVHSLGLKVVKPASV